MIGWNDENMEEKKVGIRSTNAGVVDLVDMPLKAGFLVLSIQYAGSMKSSPTALLYEITIKQKKWLVGSHLLYLFNWTSIIYDGSVFPLEILARTNKCGSSMESTIV